MSVLRAIASGFRSLLCRKRVNQELDEELHAFLDMAVQERMKQGASREDALRAVRLEHGSLEVSKEAIRSAGWESVLETSWQDVRFGLRMLRKSPGFTAVAVLTLALGIGANTAIFSYINAWMIKPLPYPEADRLVILQVHDKKNGWTRNNTSSAADFFDFQKESTSFEQTVAWTQTDFNLTGDGPPALLEGGRVNWNFFDTLGVKPILGRTFTPEDDRSGATHVVILSEGLWKSRFAAAPDIVGRNIAIGGEAYAVVGVMPGTFQFPLMGVASLWTPLALSDKARADRSGTWLPAFGRLKPGVNAEQAGAEAAAILAHLESEFPRTNTNLTWLVSGMTDEIRREEGTPAVMICFLIVGLVLLIACANVANLVLARSSCRTRELAVRGALGATRRRLARQLLIESLLLFLFGGMAGTLFGLWGMRWIESQIPEHIRGYLVNYGHVEMDLTTLAFTVAVTFLCALMFGLAPVIQESGLDINNTLKETARQGSGSRHSARLRRIFVCGEIALAMVVLISATLLVKSFIISVRSSPGYNPAHVLVAQLALPRAKYPEEWRQRNFAEEVSARIHALPQVVSVGTASSVPYGGFGQGVAFEAVGKPVQPGERQGSRFTAVSQDYFSTMQISLVQGRFFTSADEHGDPVSAIINQTFARQIWPDEDPIGKQLFFGDQRRLATVVGVVRDIKMYYLREQPERQMYVLLAQFPSHALSFVARTDGDSRATATAIRDAVWSVDRDQPLSSVEPLETLMAVVNTGDRVVTRLMVFFGALAAFLGVIGIYGVMAHLASQRTNEVGIRMALGASPAQVLRLVIGQGMRLVLVGIVVGVLGALGTARSLAAALYEVAPTDPTTFLSVAILFALAAATACYIPARRATRVDPLAALRYE